MNGFIVSIFNEGHWLWQGSFCLALGLFGSLILRRHAARAHQVLRLGLLTAILVPVLSILVQQQGLGVLPPKAQETVVSTANGSDMATIATLLDLGTFASDWEPIILPDPEPEPRVLPDAMIPVSETRTAINAKPWSIPWKQICLLIWPVVGLVFLFRLVRTFVLGMRLLFRAEPCDCDDLREAAQRASTFLSVPTNVTIKESKVVDSPMIWCWTRQPVLLVQDAQKRSTRTDWVGVFCHELAHWKRRDHLSGLWAELWLCVFWWHPLVWWVKRRLDVLSEQACDDWVLAGGHSAADYAESLLGLIPENRMAFLPTIVGKDKTMKERIVHIIKSQSRNPQVGRSWAILVCLLTSLFVVGTAFSQRRPGGEHGEERDESSGYHACVERNTELSDAFHETRVDLAKSVEELEALEKEGKGHSEEAQELREMIDELERRLVHLKRAQMQDVPVFEFQMAAEADQDAVIDKLEAALEEAETELDGVIEELGELEAVGEGDGDEADTLRGEIRQLEQKIRTLAFKRRVLEERQRHPVERVHEALAHEMRELGLELRAMKHELQELEEEGEGGSEDAQALRLKIRSVETKMQQHSRRIHAMLQGQPVRRPGETGIPDQAQDIVQREMASHQRKLRQHAEELEQELEGLPDKDSERAERIHRELEEIHREMERMEFAYHDLESVRPEPGPDLQDMQRRRVELEEKAEGLHHALDVLGDSNPELSDHLERELQGIHGQMEDLERALHEQESNRERNELDVRVDQLHEKVEQLTDEMQEIKHLLRRLVECEEKQGEDGD